jgi:hypothetical protein
MMPSGLPVMQRRDQGNNKHPEFVFTTSLPVMFTHKALSVALAIFWSAVGVSCFYDPYPCTKPSVRREWRAFSTKEKAEWIRAINVRSETLLTLVMMLNR